MKTGCTNCGLPTVGRGLCRKHYNRQWLIGLAPMARPKHGKYNKRTVVDNGDGTASVPLTKGYVATIDADDLLMVSEYTWHARTSKKSVYAATRLRDTKQSFTYLHRMVMNAPDGVEVDHVNRDTLNNRKGNLRLCDSALNATNKGKDPKGITSHHKGVMFDKERGKWRATFQYKGFRVQRRFNTEIEAARFYNFIASEILSE